MRNEFYAVTKTSIYEVKFSDGTLSVKKVRLMGTSVIPEGNISLPDGNQIVICNTIQWTVEGLLWYTSRIRGLFASVEEANAFVEIPNSPEKDELAKVSTQQIINEINVDGKHPAFVIVGFPEL